MVSLRAMKKHAIAEAEALRDNITQKQKDKLDINTFEGDWMTHCVYGQITGNCWSKPANKLIRKCVKVFCSADDTGVIHKSRKGFTVKLVKKSSVALGKRGRIFGNVYTPLELYVMNCSSTGKSLKQAKEILKIIKSPKKK